MTTRWTVEPREYGVVQMKVELAGVPRLHYLTHEEAVDLAAKIILAAKASDNEITKRLDQLEGRTHP